MIRVGDLVIVEADRGKDLGKVVNDTITIEDIEAYQRQVAARFSNDAHNNNAPLSPGANGPPSAGGAGGGKSLKEINPKQIYGKATLQDTQGLEQKIQDEMKALQLCQQKVRMKKLPMEVVDAEYQWCVSPFLPPFFRVLTLREWWCRDRRKLTFYFVAEKRIDFRELVRELFRLYKTRIWMASLQGPSYEQ